MVRQEPASTAVGNACSKSTREELILQHLPQVKLIARQISERLPVSVSMDDLISAGVVGLISAIDRFDQTQKVKLKTFAEYKIRGAILDSLRRLDCAPRQQRRQRRMIEVTTAGLQQKLNRRPNEEEIAEELGVSIERYRKWRAAADNLRVGSMEALSDREGGTSLLRSLGDSGEPSPAQLVEKAELVSLLTKMVEALPSMEKTVLRLYFYEERSLREIALIVGLHESRISQLKSQAVLRIRSFMQLSDNG